MANHIAGFLARRLWRDASAADSQSDAEIWNRSNSIWEDASSPWSDYGPRRPTALGAAGGGRGSGWIAAAIASAGPATISQPAASPAPSAPSGFFASLSGVSAAPGGLTASASPTAGWSNAAIAANVTADLSGGSLGYSSVLSILQNAAVGGMTASKFSTLQAFAAELNKPGGIAVSSYVQQIADDVILGNSANAKWNGGSSTTTALGNLSASSSQTQANELIGMWFQGTNLPSLSVSSLGESNYNPTYQTSTLPLYGSSGSPSYKDVSQGYLGDCYFVSALGEVALQNPSAIQNMITSDGNGTYGVRFYVNGQADYVTVNEQLPVMGGGYRWANGSTQEFANGTSDNWVALVEKAYAQLNAQTSAPHGMALNSASDSYAGIAAGNGSSLTLITGQSETPTSLNSREIVEHAGVGPRERDLELQVGRGGADVDAVQLLGKPGRKSHVHGDRDQRVERRADDPEPLGLLLQRAAGDELHRDDPAARVGQLHLVGRERQVDGLSDRRRRTLTLPRGVPGDARSAHLNLCPQNPL